jgi:hypothetical protein
MLLLLNNRPNFRTMQEITLVTPTFLFSAISLLMLAYTNRFLSYAQLVRTLKDKYLENPDALTAAQITNLRKRLTLTRSMQMLGVGSLFLCVVTMFVIYIGYQAIAVWLFGAALLLLITSLGISVREIQISIRALDIYLSDIEKMEKDKSLRSTLTDIFTHSSKKEEPTDKLLIP